MNIESLVVHAGVYKTGTTTMQAVLEKNESELSRQSVKYVKPRQLRSFSLNKLTRDDVSSRFLSMFEGAGSAIISDENILGRPRGVPKFGLYHAAGRRALAVFKALPAVRRHLFITLRNPVEFFASMHVEYIKHNPYCEFSAYMSSVDIDRFSWVDVFAWLPRAEARGIRTYFFRYEDPTVGGPLAACKAVLSAAGCQLSDQQLAKEFQRKRNISFTDEQMQQFEWIYRRSGQQAVRQAIDQAIGTKKPLGRKYAPFSDAVIEKVTEAYYDQCHVLLSGRTYGDGSPT